MSHINAFFFYCIVLPATVFVPEVVVPKWGGIYIPSIITLLNAVGTPRSVHLLVFWILFENVMSLHRTKATIIGLLEGSRVYLVYHVQKIRLQGYYSFSQKLKHIVRLPFAATAYGTAAMLLVMVWKPDKFPYSLGNIEVHPSAVPKPDDEGKYPNFVVYQEIIATSRPYLCTVCVVNVVWVRPILNKINILN